MAAELVSAIRTVVSKCGGTAPRSQLLAVDIDESSDGRLLHGTSSERESPDFLPPRAGAGPDVDRGGPLAQREDPS